MLSKPASLLPWLRSLAVSARKGAVTPNAVLSEAATVLSLWLDKLIRGDLENRHGKPLIGPR